MQPVRSSGNQYFAGPRLPPRPQRVASFHVQANKNSKPDSEALDKTVIKKLKVIPAILSKEEGVGIFAIAAATWLTKATIDGINAAAEKDFKPALAKRDENLAEWKDTISAAVQRTNASALESLKEIGSNMNESWSEIIAGTDAVNEKLAKEAEMGATNWEKTKSAFIAATTIPEREETDVVAVLTEAEKQGTKILKEVGEEIVHLGNREDSLQTGWAENLLSKFNLSSLGGLLGALSDESPALKPYISATETDVEASKELDEVVENVAATTAEVKAESDASSEAKGLMSAAFAAVKKFTGSFDQEETAKAAAAPAAAAPPASPSAAAAKEDAPAKAAVASPSSVAATVTEAVKDKVEEKKKEEAVKAAPAAAAAPPPPPPPPTLSSAAAKEAAVKAAVAAPVVQDPLPVVSVADVKDATMAASEKKVDSSTTTSETQSSSAKTTLDPILEAFKKGGKHVAALSAPISAGVSGIDKAMSGSEGGSSDDSLALGYSKSSTGSSGGSGGSSAGSAGGSGSGGLSGKAARDALITASALGAAVGSAATTGGSGGSSGGDGGSSGGGGGGGGGGGNDDEPSNESESNNSKNNLWIYLLLLILLIAAYIYYTEQQKQEQQKAEAKK